MRMRPYQTRTQTEIKNMWAAGARSVVAVLGTGAGKTATAADLTKQLPGSRGIMQAHRAELVGQLSVALGRAGVRHNLTVSSATRRNIVDMHFEKIGRSMYDPGAAWSVESVDTAIRRSARYDITHVFTDECHHVVPGNKWGRGLDMYPSARVLGLTASAHCRSDGQGLGIIADGFFHGLVIGPSAAELMRDGYLCEYDIKVAVPSDLDLSEVQVTTSGELNMQQAARAMHASNRIVGDAVQAYQEHAAGKLNICFAVDIEHAREIAAQYNNAGIPASMVSGEDSDDDRTSAIRRFMRREILVLVNVDLFGEGFDVPGVEVVQMCRPTASFALFTQQVGRQLRIDVADALHAIWDDLGVVGRRLEIAKSRKPRGLVLDHVGNFYRTFKIGDEEHVGPPELFTGFSLDGRTKKRQTGEAIPLRVCSQCYMPFERFYDACPFCGTAVPAPPVGKAPAHVDGSLRDYDPELLARMRAEVYRIDGAPVLPQSLSGPARLAATGQWYERQRAQAALRESIAVWAGRRSGRSETELHREFYLRFGVDVLGALACNQSAAEKLIERIEHDNGA